MAWQDDVSTFKHAGFSDDEIAGEGQRQRDEFTAAGFSPKEIDDHFGVKEPDMAPIKEMFNVNLNKKAAEYQADYEKTGKKPEVADSFFTALEAGFDESSAKMMYQAVQGKPVTPEMLLPEDAPRFHKIAAMMGTLVGDLPAMAAGTVIGSAAGAAAGTATPLPGLGTVAGGVVGGGAGGFALPTAIRQSLMQYYEKGEIHDFQDFWDRTSEVFLNTSKDALVGAISMGAGGAVLGTAAKTLGPSGAKIASIGTEIATMVTAGKAFEGQAPNADDFINAGLMIGAFHGTGKSIGKIREIFAKTGELPHAVLEEAKTNPVLQQELLLGSDGLPSVYKDMQDPNYKEPVTSPETGSMKINGMLPEQPSAPQTVFHGTNAKFETLDFERGGGMVHFAEDAAAAKRYSMDTGSGGRAALKESEVFVVTDKGEKLSFNNGEWTNPEGAKFSDKVVKQEVQDGIFSYEPKNARVVEQSVNMNKVIDTYTPEGLKTLRDALKPTNRRIKEVITAIDQELAKTPGAEGFGHKFWTLTKSIRGDEIHGAMKEMVSQLKEAGFEGIRYRDDRNASIAVFEKTAPKALTPKQAELASAQDKIMSKVGEAPEKTKDSLTLNKAYTALVDKLNPIKVATDELRQGKPLSADKNPYFLARMASDAPAKAEHFLGHEGKTGGGTLDYKTLEKTGPSLQEILTPVKDDLKGFVAFITSKRAIELEGRGIEHGMDIDAASKLVRDGSAKFEQHAQKLVEFQNSALEYAKDAGVISSKAFDKMAEAGKSYLPFKRIMPAEEAGGGTSAKNPVKRIKGSELAIQDPIKSVIENVANLVKAAEANRGKLDMVKLAEETPNQKVIEKVPTPMMPIEVKAEEVMKALESQGKIVTEESLRRELKKSEMPFTEEQIQEAIDQEHEHGNITSSDFAEKFTIFRKAERPLASDEFSVMRNGKREVYKTDPALAEAFKTLDGNGPAKNMAMKMLSTITAIKRVGITLAPDFIVRNLTKDFITGGILGESGTFSFLDVLSAGKDIVTKNDNYYNWLKSGGANGAFNKLHENYFKENIYKLDEKVGFGKQVWNLASKPKHYLEMAANLAEQSTRLAESTRVRNGETSGPNIFKAGMAAREVTVDFQRIGAKVSAYNSITAFMNAQIQGLDRGARAFKENPTEILKRGAMYITAPSLYLYFANKDDQRVQEIPQWERDLHWIIPLDDWQKESTPGESVALPSYMKRAGKDGGIEINKGVVWRIPKPQEFGVLFGTLPERALDLFFKHDPDAFHDFGKTIGGMLAPSFMPDALTPVIEQMTNRSLFSGNQIVPHHLEAVLPQYRYTDYTTDTAKALGKMVQAVPMLSKIGSDATPLSAPMVLENYVRNWSGTTGMYALQIADKALQTAGVTDVKNKPSWSVGEIPVVKAFVAKYPSGNSESIRRFYEEFKENQQVANTVKMLAKSGEFQESQNVMMDKENQTKMANLQGVADSLDNQAALIRKIYVNPDMKPSEKRQLIDGMYYGMIESARMGREMNKQFKQAQQEQKER